MIGSVGTSTIDFASTSSVVLHFRCIIFWWFFAIDRTANQDPWQKHFVQELNYISLTLNRRLHTQTGRSCSNNSHCFDALASARVSFESKNQIQNFKTGMWYNEKQEYDARNTIHTVSGWRNTIIIIIIVIIIIIIIKSIVRKLSQKRHGLF